MGAADTDKQGWFTPGQEVAGLRIERFLGQGAFSTVYLARDVLIDRVVALKVLNPVTGELSRPIEAEEVLNEARLVGRLSSPHIVTLYRVHPPTADGRWMFEMEYLEGGTLEDQLEGGRSLPWSQALPLARSVTEGLRDAHAADVVHGDVKAGNVLLGLDGTARLADFGLARLVGDAPLTGRGSGSPRGTPMYMAPEVLLGRSAGAQADLWSLGVLIYRMLAGRFPFEAEDFRVLFHAVQSKAPPALGPDVPPRLAELVLACLAKRPEDRPAGAAAVLERLPARARIGPLRPAAAPAPTGELLGRDEETARIRTALDQGEAVMVTGATGLGRTAVLAQAAADGRLRGEIWISVAVPPGGGLLPPLYEALLGALGAAASSLATEARFGARATVLRDVLERGIDAHRIHGPWIVSELLGVLADAAPTILALDDVQNVDEEDGALLAQLGRRECGVVLTQRAERSDAPTNAKVQALTGSTTLRRIHLEGLAPEWIYALIEARASTARVDAVIADRIVELAGGSPLFALDLLHHLDASRAVEVVGGVLVPGPSWDRVPLPQRLQDVAARRLAALSPEERELLDVAAVDGETFDGDAVAAVSEQPLLEVLRRLQRLYREHGIVRPEADGYRFAHRLLHEAVYEGVAPELRQVLHLRLAEHLASRSGRRRVDPARIGEHWKRGGEPHRALPHLVQAMGEAARREEFRRARGLAEQAGLDPRTLDAELAREHLDDLLGLARAYQQAGAKDDLEALYNRLFEITADGGDEGGRAYVLAHAAWTRYTTRGLAEDEIPMLERLSDAPTGGRARAMALAVLGRHALEGGDYAEAESRLRAADAAWAGLGEDADRGAPLLLIANCARRLGRLREAEQLFLDAAEVNRRAGNGLLAIMCDVNRLLTQYERGSTAGLQSGFVRAVHQFELLEALHQANQTRCFLASVRYALGDAEGAMAVQEAALDWIEPHEYRPALAMAYPNLARWRLAAGDFSRAGELRQAWGALHDKADPADADCERTIYDAREAALRGAREKARALAQQALGRVLELRNVRSRVKQAAALAESVHFGVPGDVMEPLRDVLREIDLPEDPMMDLARALVDGALALTDPDADPAQLREAALALRDSPTAEGRATRLATAGWLLAEAARRAGDLAKAEEEANRALATAVALQNVWLQMHLLGVLARVHPGDVFRERREALVHHVAKNLDAGAARDRFEATWSIPFDSLEMRAANDTITRHRTQRSPQRLENGDQNGG